MSSAGKQQDKQAPGKPKARPPLPEEAWRDPLPVQPAPPALERLSGQPGTQRLRQATLLQMQRQLGNAYVQRLLANRPNRTTAAPAPAESAAPAEVEQEGLAGGTAGPPSLAASTPPPPEDSAGTPDASAGPGPGAPSAGSSGATPNDQPMPAGLVQRQAESEGAELTEAEKQAAKARAQAAAAQAAQTAKQGQQSAAESKNQKKGEAQAKQAAKASKQQADSAAKSQQAKGKDKEKPKDGDPAKKKGPVKQKGQLGPAAGPKPGVNGAAAGPGKKAPASPDEDPGFKQVIAKAKQVAAQEKTHEPAEKKSKEAQKAAQQPPQEKTAKAQANKVGEMAAAETPGFDKAAFKAQLMQRIQAMAPRTTKEADDFKGSGKLDGLKGEMKGNVAQEKETAQGPVKQKAQEAPDPGTVPDKPTEPAPPPKPGPPPPKLGAEAAAPKKKTAHEVEKPLQESSQSLDQQMQEADISEEQLANSNEPEFQSALEQKKEAQTHAKEAPKGYREAEQAEIESAQAEAAAVAQEKTQGMHDQRAQLLEQVGGKQGDAKSKDEAARAKISADMQKIYADTKSKVESILDALDGKVEQAFDQGAEAAKKAFEDYVDAKMTAYKEDRYGGWLGWAKWAKDKLLGMPGEVNAFYAQGRKLFIDKMDAVIDHVTEIIAKDLTAAKAEIANGRKAIQDYLAQLPEDLQKVGAEAAQQIQGKFDDLEQQVDAKQGELIDTLANKYSQHLQAVDARIEELKAANKGLVDKAIDAVKGVINTIIELKNMLLGVLSRVADVVGKIIKAPVKFLGNLLGAVKKGFNQFVGNIATHLKKGFMGWLTGAISDAGIELPENFDLKGIFKLVMQILGLTFDKLRQRISGVLGFDPFAFYDQIMGIIAIYQEEGLPGLAKAGLSRLLGPEKLEALMQVVGIINLVREGDFGALFEIVQEKLADLKDMIFDKIQEYLIERVIKSAVTWLIGLFNPVGAFIKAAKMIYDVIMFFIERGKQIMELINAIIDSVGAIVSGNLGGAAAMVENALAKAIPVAISFLASLLGLGGISKKVREVIEAVRGKVEGALDAVFNSKPVQMVGGFIRKVVDKVKNVAAAGVGKVKSLAAAGASKVKGAAKAGVGKVKGALGGGDKKGAAAGTTAAAATTYSKQEKDAAKGAFTTEEKPYVKNGTISKKDAEKVAKAVKKKHRVIKKISVVDGGDSWNYRYVFRQENEEDTPTTKDKDNPRTSAPGIGTVAVHGAQPSRNRKGPRIHHTQSEHIIPFATARSIRLAVGLNERSRKVLGRFDRGMITLMIYRGAADAKNAKDNEYSAQFEQEMRAANIPAKTERARQQYEGGNKAGGEAIAAEVVSAITSALEKLRKSAVSRTQTEIRAEWAATEPGFNETNGQRRGEAEPVPKDGLVESTAQEQFDGILELVKEALLAQAVQESAQQSWEGRSMNEPGISNQLRTAGYNKPYQTSTGRWVIARPSGSKLRRLTVDAQNVIHHMEE